MQILTKRPSDMSFEDYKSHLKIQKAFIKEHLKGILYYKASEIYYAPEDKNKMFGLRTSYSPFKGKMKDITEPIIQN